jgi:hypothetical protein
MGGSEDAPFGALPSKRYSDPQGETRHKRARGLVPAEARDHPHALWPGLPAASVAQTRLDPLTIAAARQADKSRSVPLALMSATAFRLGGQARRRQCYVLPH